MADLASVFTDQPYRRAHRYLLARKPMRMPQPTDYGRACTPSIVIERLVADESSRRDFRYERPLLADSAGIALKDMMGRLLAVSLVRPGSTAGSPVMSRAGVTVE